MGGLVAVRLIYPKALIGFSVFGEPQGSSHQSQADQRRQSQGCEVHVCLHGAVLPMQDGCDFGTFRVTFFKSVLIRPIHVKENSINLGVFCSNRGKTPRFSGRPTGVMT